MYLSLGAGRVRKKHFKTHVHTIFLQWPDSVNFRVLFFEAFYLQKYGSNIKHIFLNAGFYHFHDKT